MEAHSSVGSFILLLISFFFFTTCLPSSSFIWLSPQNPCFSKPGLWHCALWHGGFSVARIEIPSPFLYSLFLYVVLHLIFSGWFLLLFLQILFFPQDFQAPSFRFLRPLACGGCSRPAGGTLLGFVLCFLCLQFAGCSFSSS